MTTLISFAQRMIRAPRESKQRRIGERRIEIDDLGAHVAPLSELPHHDQWTIHVSEAFLYASTKSR